MTTQRMDDMTSERERHAKTVTRVEAEAAAKRQLLITDVNNWEHPSAIEDADTCARFILSIAPGKDVVERARKIAPEIWNRLRGTYDIDDWQADVLTEALAAFATAHAARERAEYDALFRWLFGEEGEFPERQPGQGAYYWRSELRKRLDAIRARTP